MVYVPLLFVNMVIGHSLIAILELKLKFMLYIWENIYLLGCISLNIFRIFTQALLQLA